MIRNRYYKIALCLILLLTLVLPSSGIILANLSDEDTVFASLAPAGNGVYALSIRNVKNLTSLEVKFEPSGLLDWMDIDGFSTTYDFNKGTYTFMFQSGDGTGFTSETPVDVVKILIDSDEPPKLAYVVAAGYSDGNIIFFNSAIEAGGTNGSSSDFIAVGGVTVTSTSFATAGVPLELSGTVAPSGATKKAIVWSVLSAGGTGATVSGNTFYAETAKEGGENVVMLATITDGLAPGLDYTRQFTIRVNPAQAVFVPVANIADLPESATAGIPLELSGTILPANATNQTIMWSITDAGTTGATIAGNVFSATSAGAVGIMATIGNGTSDVTDYSKTFNINVVESQVDFIAVTDITGVPAETAAGAILPLTCQIAPDNATNTTVNWSVANPGATGATIAGNLLSTTAAGTVTVWATIENGKSAGEDYTELFTIDVVSQDSEPKTFTVDFILSGGTRIGGGALSQRIEEGGSAIAPAVARSGYMFDGWDKPFSVVREDITVTALWSLIAGGGSDGGIGGDVDEIVAVDGIYLTSGGYATAGVPLALTGTVLPEDATNKTVVWSVKNPGGTGATITDSTFSATSAGTAVIEATIENGLAEGDDFTQVFDISVSAAPETTYRVVFDLDGGTRTGGGLLTQYVEQGTAAIAPTATMTNYRFDGWDRNFNNVTADITVTALWTYVSTSSSSSSGSNWTPRPLSTGSGTTIASADPPLSAESNPAMDYPALDNTELSPPVSIYPEASPLSNVPKTGLGSMSFLFMLLGTSLLAMLQSALRRKNRGCRFK